MDKCNDCWMNEYKNTKDRPIHCAGCEFNFHWNELINPLRELLFIN